MLKLLIKTMRPKQWYKNVIVFVGIFFSLNILDFSLLLKSVFAFFIFCALSGSEYIINDIIDIEKDKKHPIKSQRPIASGKLRIAHALPFSIILIAIALYGSYLINIEFFSISVVFILLTLAYSFWLKNILLVDALTIAIDFVIRATAGTLAIGATISPWITICTMLLASILVFGKRRHEIRVLGEEAHYHRGILRSYTIEMLNQYISIISGALIIAYSLYTFYVDNLWMMTTIPIVVYGIFRYLFLIQVKNAGGEPEEILKDKGMIIAMAIWVILCALILYNVPGAISQWLG